MTLLHKCKYLEYYWGGNQAKCTNTWLIYDGQNFLPFWDITTAKVLRTAPEVSTKEIKVCAFHSTEHYPHLSWHCKKSALKFVVLHTTANSKKSPKVAKCVHFQVFPPHLRRTFVKGSHGVHLWSLGTQVCTMVTQKTLEMGLSTF